jgi:hypothetical protein
VASTSIQKPVFAVTSLDISPLFRLAANGENDALGGITKESSSPNVEII